MYKEIIAFICFKTGRPACSQTRLDQAAALREEMTIAAELKDYLTLYAYSIVE